MEENMSNKPRNLNELLECLEKHLRHTEDIQASVHFLHTTKEISDVDFERARKNFNELVFAQKELIKYTKYVEIELPDIIGELFAENEALRKEFFQKRPIEKR